MRAEHGTLDALSPVDFRYAVVIGIVSADGADPALNDALTESYGLKPTC